MDMNRDTSWIAIGGSTSNGTLLLSSCSYDNAAILLTVDPTGAVTTSSVICYTFGDGVTSITNVNAISIDSTTGGGSVMGTFQST